MALNITEAIGGATIGFIMQDWQACSTL